MQILVYFEFYILPNCEILAICVDFIFIVAKYLFLTCNVSVTEIEELDAISLKPINQSITDYQSI